MLIYAILAWPPDLRGQSHGKVQSKTRSCKSFVLKFAWQNARQTTAKMSKDARSGVCIFPCAMGKVLGRQCGQHSGDKPGGHVYHETPNTNQFSLALPYLQVGAGCSTTNAVLLCCLLFGSQGDRLVAQHLIPSTPESKVSQKTPATQQHAGTYNALPQRLLLYLFVDL